MADVPLTTETGDELSTVSDEILVLNAPFSTMPNVFSFYQFILNVLQPPSIFVPGDSPQVQYAFDFALQWVSSDLQFVPGLPSAMSLYALAVYNLAADTLIAWQPDGPSDPTYADGLQYWAWLRKRYNVLAFVPGIVQSTSDEGTSSSYLLPESYSGYTIANIQNTKTPYGRAYLGIAQSQGTLWGLS